MSAILDTTSGELWIKVWITAKSGDISQHSIVVRRFG